jgi:hypothetical protein
VGAVEAVVVVVVVVAGLIAVAALLAVAGLEAGADFGATVGLCAKAREAVAANIVSDLSKVIGLMVAGLC